MAQQEKPHVLSDGDHAVAQVFWITTTSVLLFAGAAFYILL
jgi:hypothetical protein